MKLSIFEYTVFEFCQSNLCEIRSGPMRVTFAGFSVSRLTKRYSSKGVLRTKRSRSTTGRLCETAVPFSSPRTGNSPTLQRIRAFNPLLIKLETGFPDIIPQNRLAKAILKIEPPIFTVGHNRQP